MFSGSILFVITFAAHLGWSTSTVSTAQSVKNLPSLCCITGDNRNYKINTTFITADCQSKCVCTQDAFLACIPLCPTSIGLKCPIGFVRRDVKVPFPTKKKICYCKTYTCVPIPGNTNTQTCSEGNKLYQLGEGYIRNCNERCRCLLNGKVRCVSLCPKLHTCMVDHTAKNVSVPVPYSNGKCQCTAKACKPYPYKDKCVVNGQTYKTGDSFISADCSSSCECNPGGKVFCRSLCSPQGSYTCKPGQQPSQVMVKFPNSKCMCPATTCKNNQMIHVTAQFVGSQVPTQPPLPKYHCTASSGQLYLIGSVFSDNNCGSQCHCLNGGVLSCQPLCSPVVRDSSCTNHKTSQVSAGIPDAQGNRCSCTVVSCV